MIVSFSVEQQLLIVLLYRKYSMNMKELRVKKLMETRQPYFFVTILQMLLGIGLLIFLVQLLLHNLRNVWGFLPLLEEQRRELLMKSMTEFGENCKAGREILIKAVIQAIPSYATTVFRFPIGLCQEITSMANRYWWGQRQGERKIHWLNKNI